MRISILYMVLLAPLTPAADPPKEKVEELGRTGPAVLTTDGETRLPVKPAAPKSVTGDVQALEDAGGGMIEVAFFATGNSYAGRAYMVVAGDGSKITLNGKPATLDDVKTAWAVPYPWMRATLHPRVDRYGASTEAEFVTDPRAKGKKAAKAFRLNGSGGGAVAVAVAGDDTIEVNTVGELSPVGLPDGGVVFWQFPPAVSVKELPDGTVHFAGPPGVYPVKMTPLISPAAGKLQKLPEITGTVTITAKATAADPFKGTGEQPRTAAAPVQARPLQYVKVGTRQVCTSAGCYLEDVYGWR